MLVTKSENFGEFTDLLEKLENSTMMLKALGHLLETAMRDKKNFFPDLIADGTSMLFNQQFKMLEFLESSFRLQYYEMQKYGLKIHDVNTISGMSGLPKGIVESVLSFAMGAPSCQFSAEGESA